MDFQNFIYLLFALVWLSGLIWAGVIAFRNRKGRKTRCDVCGKKMLRGGVTKIYKNGILIGYYHGHCHGVCWFAKAESVPLNLDSEPMNARRVKVSQ